MTATVGVISAWLHTAHATRDGTYFHGVAPLVAIIMVLACADAKSDGASGDRFSIFVSGDTIVTQPFADIADPDRDALLRLVREADVAVTNLETTLGEFKSFPQRDSGGQHLMARGRLAEDLAWAGFDMLAAANNHTYDYGSLGVLETIDSAARAGLVVAGAAPDLQNARGAVFHRSGQQTVALLAVTSTFIDYGVAGRSRSDMIGRPGPNPLHVHSVNKFVKLVAYAQAFLLQQISRLGVGMAGVRLNAVDQRDLDEITAAIRQAHLAADYVLLSIHAHYPGVWLEDFARAAIDAGVDVVFAHGPHTVTGIEIYHDRPIFYSLGNFAFQYELSEKLPADAFEHFGLDPDSSLDAYFAAEREADGYQSFNRRPETWEGLGAVVTFEGTRLANVRLVPIDLGFAQELPARGLPRLARGAIRDAVFSAVIDQSRRYGTIVQFDASGDAATISLAGGR